MTSQPRDKTRDSTKHDTAKFGIDLYEDEKPPHSEIKCMGVKNILILFGSPMISCAITLYNIASYII